MRKSLIIGVAGGSGSGKSTISKRLKELNGNNRVEIIDQSAYALVDSSLDLLDRRKVNLGHPSNVDFDLLKDNINDLILGKSTNSPVFDYHTYERTDEIIKYEPKDIVIVEGSLVLYDSALRDLFDIKVYVDTDADIRLIRKILKDTKEKSLDIDNIILDYISRDKNVYMNFVEPTKRFADIIIPEGGENEIAIDILNSKIKGTFDRL